MEHGFQFYIEYANGPYVPNEDTNLYDSVAEALEAADNYIKWLGGKASMKNIGIDEVTVEDGFVEVVQEVIYATELLYEEDE